MVHRLQPFEVGVQVVLGVAPVKRARGRVLLLSQAIETHFAAQLLERHADRFGYLLKDRVMDVAAGGTVLDPEIALRLVRAHSRKNPLLALSDREREVLGQMAEGRSNAAIAGRLVVSGKTVEGHIANIFTKLGLHDAPDDHRRVLAVLAELLTSIDPLDHHQSLPGSQVGVDPDDPHRWREERQVKRPQPRGPACWEITMIVAAERVGQDRVVSQDGSRDADS